MKALILSALILVTGTALAEGRTYGLVSLSYADASQAQGDAKGAGYGLAMGYEFHRQWYVELGFQRLLDEEPDTPTLNNLGSDDTTGMETDALYLAALGKASSEAGTLFYRLGIMSVKQKQTLYLAADNVCDQGVSALLPLPDGGAARLCQFDENLLAGTVGLGFDFSLSSNLSVRTEFQHIRGEDDFEMNMGHIGVKYTF